MATPDEQIHPHATGLAAQTAEKHKDSQDLVFYAGWFCPYVQRAWITLEEKNVPYQYVEVNPYKREKEFLDINPKGLVPALTFRGQPLYESLVLCEFIDDEFLTSGTHLLPVDPFGRARARLWIDHITKAIVPAFMRTIQAQDPEKQRAALEELHDGLRTLCAQIDARGPYFLGRDFSLVDVAIAPWVLRDYILAENRGYSREAVGNGWKEYAEALEKRDSVQRTQSEKEYYAEIYGRYLRDEAQSQTAKAIRAGRGLP